MMYALLFLLTLVHPCNIHNGRPDRACTPGDAISITVYDLCSTSTSTRRKVSESLRRQVFQSYGITYPPPAGAYELDHLIPLELGGSNDASNLWPEAAPGFHEKDLEENRLRREVCSGEKTLAAAQAEILKDWAEVP